MLATKISFINEMSIAEKVGADIKWLGKESVG